MQFILDEVELEIVENIAEGGMGCVYKALQKGVEGFAKTVAIKTLLTQFSHDKNFVDMFIGEAMLVANLVHENIVQIYQLGKYEETYYFVLEYVDGISLHEFLEFHRKIYVTIPVPLAVFIASRIARGLAYAHSRKDLDGLPLNIVHCDVCPNNILINTEGLPKLTDFGIAKAANLSSHLGVSGKLPFMSPEQATKGNPVDFRSDIYSLGIVLFEMLSGQVTRNLDVPDIHKILEQARDNYIAWDRLPSEVDDELRDLLQKMLAKNPEKRYQQTRQLAHDLEYYIYKDGYGPTIVTLAEYMRKQMPAIFQDPTSENQTTDNYTPPDKTVLM